MTCTSVLYLILAASSLTRTILSTDLAGMSALLIKLFANVEQSNMIP